MKRAITALRWLVVAMLVAGAGLLLARYLHSGGTGGRYGKIEVVRPQGAVRAMVVMFADGDANAQGISDFHLARSLTASGALVAIIDTPRYLRRINAAGAVDCGQLADDAERLGKRLLRKQKVEAFLPPLLVGRGQGALLARQALAAATPQILGGAVVVGDEHRAKPAVLACPMSLPMPAQGVLVALPDNADAASLVAAARAHFQTTGDRLTGLPLVELPVPGSDQLVILLSGDGGWRELDKDMAAALQRQGISVVGWNSLRYFWSEKTPSQLAADLGQVIAEYRQRWKIKHIALVGYSFGADVMPFAYAELPAQQRAHVQFVSLLGLAHTADFKVRVRDWIGWGTSSGREVVPAMTAFSPQHLQCIYGAHEKDTVCPELRALGVDVQMRPGGHHFDRNPAALATLIVQGWQRATTASAEASS